ncbi:hypothetical protein Mesau_05715 [Mesorhizobium australicum WSM2073]|uniref:Uncharacterized protein n=3 Tax=Mesorhizobium TaxID=68287 RepID=L0KV98_MESAW|nr:hypothetical protein Mesci_5662 [Mesorhizobium ciceri biovar biserrulae WSM1271]AEH90631.1 hypothetical protein Mesop_6244 [Mesorhizobium opportunistum WSM2075]AGB48003.1 hypothetical protein Mesau_05715 [Mesorhizobium australicum WSM2073]OBP89903.1 hypothetical protein BAE40_13395 [Mesorhizobium loti]
MNLRSGAPVVAASDDIKATNFLLDKGVVLVPDHRAPTITHMVRYKIGSADEPAREIRRSGISLSI